MKHFLKPSDITCSTDEFRVASDIVIAGINHRNTKTLSGAVQATASILHVTTPINIKNVSRIVNITKSLLIKLDIPLEGLDAEALKERLLSAMEAADDFYLQGVGKAVRQKLGHTVVYGISTDILDYPLEDLCKGEKGMQTGFMWSDNLNKGGRATIAHILALHESFFQGRMRGLGKATQTRLLRLLKEKKDIDFPLPEEGRSQIEEYLKTKKTQQ